MRELQRQQRETRKLQQRREIRKPQQQQREIRKQQLQIATTRQQQQRLQQILTYKRMAGDQVEDGQNKITTIYFSHFSMIVSILLKQVITIT